MNIWHDSSVVRLVFGVFLPSASRSEHRPLLHVIAVGGACALKALRARRVDSQSFSNGAVKRGNTSPAGRQSFSQTLLKGFSDLKFTFPFSWGCLNLPTRFGRWCSPDSTRTAILPPAAAQLPRPGTIWDTTRLQRDLTAAWDLPSVRYVQSDILKLLLQHRPNSILYIL